MKTAASSSWSPTHTTRPYARLNRRVTHAIGIPTKNTCENNRFANARADSGGCRGVADNGTTTKCIKRNTPMPYTAPHNNGRRNTIGNFALNP